MNISLPESKTKFLKTPGFTLIELLIVMAIIGVLATLFIGGYTGTQRKARDANRKSDLKQIANSLEIYFNDHNRYPAESSGTIAGCPSTTSTSCAWGSGEFTDTLTVYYKTVPADPLVASGGIYVYHTDANGTFYRLFARLENLQDSDIITTLESCGTGGCNFAITSGNVNP